MCPIARAGLSSSSVTVDPALPRLRACPVAIDDPGDVLDYLAEASDVAWIRRGDGLVGLGVAARVDVASLDDGAEWLSLIHI